MHFSCRCCRELKVSKMVISKLRAESNDVREQLSQQARALRGGRISPHRCNGSGVRCSPEGNLPGRPRCGRGPCEQRLRKMPAGRAWLPVRQGTHGRAVNDLAPYSELPTRQ